MMRRDKHIKYDSPASRAVHVWLAHLECRHVNSRMAEWGVACLEAEIGGGPVILLAGADFDEPQQVSRLFHANAGSIGISLPEEGTEDAEEWLESVLCKKVMRGESDERAALGKLYSLWLRSGSGDRFSKWMYLMDSIELVESGYAGIGPFANLSNASIKSTISRKSGQSWRIAE